MTHGGIKMNIQKTQRKSRKIQVLAVFFAVLALAAAAWFLFTQKNETSPQAQYDNSSTKEQRESAEDTIKENFVNYPKENGSGDGTEPANPSQSTGIEITSLSQDAQTKSVTITTKLEGSSWTDCTVTLSQQGAKAITRTAKTVYINDYTTCEGFSIARSAFSAAGEWTVLLQGKKVDGKVHETSKTISIQ